jgi:hypothetical protein
MDRRTGNAVFSFAVLCAITAFILITSFRGAPIPETPALVWDCVPVEKASE